MWLFEEYDRNKSEIIDIQEESPKGELAGTDLDFQMRCLVSVVFRDTIPSMGNLWI